MPTLLPCYNTKSLAVQLKVVRLYVGSFFTSLNMQGAGITLLPLDPQRLTWLDAPTQVRTGLSVCLFQHRQRFSMSRFTTDMTRLLNYCYPLVCL